MLCYAKSLQSCPTLCDPIDGSPPGSPVPGILQARTLEWGVISFSNAWKWKVKVKSLSRVRLLATPWSAAYQAPPSMGFSRQEYCSRVFFGNRQYWEGKKYTYLHTHIIIHAMSESSWVPWNSCRSPRRAPGTGWKFLDQAVSESSQF